MIHPTAIVSKNAKLGENIEIGPYAIVSDNVEIGNNCTIMAHAVIDDGARIGNNVKIFYSASISAPPQDLKYSGEDTHTYIGDNTVIREFATINRGTTYSNQTVIGKNCLLMAYTHVAHDCILGNNIIMSNVVQLAGHCVVEDWVIFGGVAKVHQFSKIGMHSMVGADCKIVKDIAPFTLIGKEPPKVEGINKIGLRRRGFSREKIDAIDTFYNKLFHMGMNNSEAIKVIESENLVITEEVKHCINFIKASERGIYRAN